MKKEAEIKEKFIKLIGGEALGFIVENNNIVNFDVKPFKIYKRNEIEINFLMVDGKQDAVIFQTINYNEDTKKWSSENCIYEESDIPFDTFEEMKKHNDSIEHLILENDFPIIELPCL